MIKPKNSISSETVSMKFHKFIMLIVFGGISLFIGNKMHKKDDA